MNNKGKSMFVPVVVVIGLLLLGLAVYGIFQIKPAEQTFTGGTDTGGGIGGTTIVTTNPVISVAAVDNQALGTTVGNSIQYSVAGGGWQTASSTSLAPGTNVQLFVTNGTTYHNAAVPSFAVTTSSFPLALRMNKNATVTENMYTTTGLVLTNSAGTANTQNQTDLGNAATYNIKDEMQANALTSTQDMVCVVEISAGNNASTSPVGATYGGMQPTTTAKPVWYTAAGVNSNVYLFNMPALSSTATVTNNLQLTAKSNGRFGATSYVKKTCYTKEYFIDPVSGSVTYDVADSEGTLKSLASYTYQFYFQ